MPDNSSPACIPDDKYYDISEQRTLTNRDGRQLQDWIKYSDDAKFGIHPSGFPVFLDPSELDGADEYSESDPYGVQTELDSELEEEALWQKRRFDSTIQLLKEALSGRPQTPRILDIGCGEGHITAEMLNTFPNAEISGLDYSISAIATAKNKYDGIDFVVADAYSPPYRPNHFDVVVCNNIWEHVPDPLRLLESMKRILVADGYVLISTPSRYNIYNLARVLLGKPVKFNSSHHVTEYTVGQVVEQLRFGGFDARVLSLPYRTKTRTLKRAVRKLVKPMMLAFLWLIGSHHSLEDTVFYLAKRVTTCNG